MRGILNITRETFEPFGKVIGFTETCKEQFEIVVEEKQEPWRVAMYRYPSGPITRLENHPTSMETFEPVSGVTLLVVGVHESPKDYQVFLLDRPVCLYKGIWHQVIALTPEASVKITENLEVNSEFYELEQPLGIYAIES